MSSSLTIDDIANRLNARPSASRPRVDALSAPLAEQMMLLDVRNIRPYESNPRRMRNPAYDEIKESIQQRGLEQPLTVTRRPGEEHFIVARGGNTRLQILQELQEECQDGRFDKVQCLFTPWVGETQILTSHLIENEKRGQLLFIEKALAVDKLRKLYEAEANHPLTQAELAQRLAGDGIGVTQPLISRMRDAITFLYPAIPNLFNQGLNTEAVKKLVKFHNNCMKAWDEFAPETKPSTDFDSFYYDVLARYDVALEDFSHKSLEDALIGEMAQLFEQAYGTIESIVREDESRAAMRTLFLSLPADKFKPLEVPPPPPSTLGNSATRRPIEVPLRSPATSKPPHPVHDEGSAQNSRLHSIKNLIEAHIGDETADAFASLEDAPPEACMPDPLPVCGVLEIDPEGDDCSSLRAQTAQLAREIAESTEPEARIFATEAGAGYEFRSPGQESWDRWSTSTRLTLLLLRDLSGRGRPKPVAQLGGLLCGLPTQGTDRVSDEVFCKFIRLIWLLRRLGEHGNFSPGDGLVSAEPATNIEPPDGDAQPSE